MNQHSTEDADDGRDQDHKYLQSHSQPFAETLEFEQLQIDGALFVQVFGLYTNQLALGLYQPALFVEIGSSLLGQLGILLAISAANAAAVASRVVGISAAKPSAGGSLSVPKIPDTPPDLVMPVPHLDATQPTSCRDRLLPGYHSGTSTDRSWPAAA